jgi:hypothetical protein
VLTKETVIDGGAMVRVCSELLDNDIAAIAKFTMVNVVNGLTAVNAKLIVNSGLRVERTAAPLKRVIMNSVNVLAATRPVNL